MMCFRSPKRVYMNKTAARHGQKLLLIVIFSIAFDLSSAQENYIVGTEDSDYFPYIGKTKGSNELSGYAIDFFDAFSESVNASFDYHELPVKRLFKIYLFENTLDFKYPDSASWKPELREGKTIHYSMPINRSINGLIINLDNKPANASAIKTIGTIRGVAPWSYTEGIKSGNIVLIEYAKTSHLLKSLLAKRIDAAYIDTEVANYYLKAFPDSQQRRLRYDASFPHDLNLYQISSMRHPEIIYRLNQFIKNNPKIIEELSKKYGFNTVEKGVF